GVPVPVLVPPVPESPRPESTTGTVVPVGGAVLPSGTEAPPGLTGSPSEWSDRHATTPIQIQATRMSPPASSVIPRRARACHPRREDLDSYSVKSVGSEAWTWLFLAASAGVLSSAPDPKSHEVQSSVSLRSRSTAAVPPVLRYTVSVSPTSATGGVL